LVGVLAVLASGCRIAFDDVRVDAAAGDSAPPIDVVLGHDEDGDGIADSDDFCPHIASAANGDMDSDGVGDVCDREPTLPNQSWSLFSPMTSGSLPLSNTPAGAWTKNADDWHYIDTGGPVQLVRDSGIVGNVDAWIGLDVETVGTGGVQAAIILDGTNVPYWYGEMYDDGINGARISIAEYTGTTYVARTTMALGGGFPLGPNDLSLSATIGGAHTVRLGSLMTTFATPTHTGQRYLIFAVGNHSGRVRYVAIITSQ
jgi:hypothetical protein